VADKKGALGQQYYIEDIFDSYNEYQDYLLRALASLKVQAKNRKPSLHQFVPERLEISFVKKLKAPRYYMPRFTGVIVLEVPDNNLSPQKKAAIRQMRLDSHIGVVKINELQCADQLAMRNKILDKKSK
jgi:hypothetical protein